VNCLDNWVEECKLEEIDVDLNSLLNRNIYLHRTCNNKSNFCPIEKCEYLPKHKIK
jgi:hypothetical protein